MLHLARMAAILLVCSVVALLTTPAYLGDTELYVSQILKHRAHLLAPGQDPFWDFGHTAWRPLVNAVFGVAGPAAKHLCGGDQRQALAWLMFVITAVSTLAAILLLWSFLERHSNPWAAWIAAIACLSANAIIDYSRSGAPYVPALACLMLALWLIQRAHARPDAGMLLAILAGLSMCASVTLWFPFVLATPAALLYALYGSPMPLLRFRIRLAAVMMVVCGCALTAAYGVVIRERQIHSWTDLKSWISASQNDWAQTDRIKRAVSGIPRSFLDLGDDTLLLKRYAFHDPYARVSLWKVLIAPGTIKLLLFYLYTGAVILVLWRTYSGRGVLVLLAAAAVPVLVFGVILFEPGSTERYLPVYPFFFWAAACALAAGGAQYRTVCRGMAVFLLVVWCAGNIYAKSGWRSAGQYRAFLERKNALDARAQSGSLVAVINLRDPIYYMPALRLLDHQAQPHNFQVYDVIETASARVFRWRRQFAELSLARWSKGRQVWLSNRLLAERPQPEWRWVEGDTGRVKWIEIRTFFRSFDVTVGVDGSDGFVLLAESPHNQESLRELASK